MNEIGHALFGLRNLPASKEALSIVAALTKKVIGSTSPTTVEAMAVAEALQGLRSLGDAPEVRAFLAAFTPKIAEAKPLTPRPLVWAVLALPNLALCEETQALLSILAKLAAASEESLSP